MMNTVRGILDDLVARGVVKASELRGLSEQEIAAIEQRHGSRLPGGAYRTFLARAGQATARNRFE